MASSPNKVLASRIDTITLHNNRLTTARRVSAIPQLKCIGGSAKGHFEVDTMRCRAQGRGYEEHDIQWTCTADTGPYFKLGSTQVLCEGYDHPEDPYILKGSCGVEYRLMLTDEGEKRYPVRHEKHGHESADHSSVAGWVFAVLFLAVASIILFKVFSAWHANRGQGRQRPIAEHGHNSNDDDDSGNDEDLPPPYSETPDNNAGSSGQSMTGALGRGLAYGTGAAAAARVVRSTANAYARRSRTHEDNDDDNAGEGSSSTRTNQQSRQPPRNGVRTQQQRSDWMDRSSSRSTNDGGSTLHQSAESTGFGGTTRR